MNIQRYKQLNERVQTAFVGSLVTILVLHVFTRIHHDESSMPVYQNETQVQVWPLYACRPCTTRRSG